MHRLGWSSVILVVLGWACSREEPANPCLGVDCSGQGICTERSGVAACECYLGYRGRGLECVRDPNIVVPELPPPPAGDEATGAPGEADRSAERLDRPAEEETVVAALNQVAKLTHLLVRFNREVESSFGNCPRAVKELLAFIDQHRPELQTGARQLPELFRRADTQPKRKKAAELSAHLEGTIWETNRLMSILGQKCSDASKIVGSALAGTKICTFNPEDGRVTNCLKPETW